MRAVVLVGGFGTRLRPLTLNTPKQLLPIVGTSMFERVIARLAKHGIDEAIVSLGFRPDRFVSAFPDGVCCGVKLHYAIEPEPLDTAGAIRFAALDANVDDTFLVVNGDVLTDLDYSWLVEQHRQLGAEATLHLISVDDPSRFGVVSTDADHRVLEFVEKPAPGTEPTNLINAGTYVMEPSVLDRIAGDRKVSVERDTFPKLAHDGTLFAVASDVYWIDAGTPSAYLTANLDLIDGTRSTETAVDPTAVIDGSANVHGSVVGASVTIGAGTTIEGSVLMGDVVIGSGVTVSNSVIGTGATIGDGANITDGSVVGQHVQVATGLHLDGVLVPDKSTWE